MKKVLAAAAALIALTALAGCAASTEAKTGDGQITARYVDLPDGGQVACVFWVPVDGLGYAEATGAQMSCDWPTATPLEDE